MDFILQRIIEEMNLKKVSQKEVTRYLNIAESSFGGWKAGRNTSYLKYIHAIASYLDVSVEYLKGETDIKKPPIENDERLDEVYELVKDLDESEQMALKAFVAGLKANRKPD